MKKKFQLVFLVLKVFLSIKFIKMIKTVWEERTSQ